MTPAEDDGAGRDPPAPRRFFLPIGVSRPRRELRALRVDEDIARLEEIFVDTLNYRRVRLEENPSYTELRAGLLGWLGEASLNRSDDLVVYYTGHGHLDEHGEFYLCTRGFSEDEPGLSLRPETLLDILLVREQRPGKLFFILDCCHAGGALAPLVFQRLVQRLDAGALLVSAGTYDLARDGAFSRAFVDSVREQHGRGALNDLARDLTGRLAPLGQQVRALEVGAGTFDYLRPYDAALRARTSDRAPARDPRRATPPPREAMATPRSSVAGPALRKSPSSPRPRGSALGSPSGTMPATKRRRSTVLVLGCFVMGLGAPAAAMFAHGFLAPEALSSEMRDADAPPPSGADQPPDVATTGESAATTRRREAPLSRSTAGPASIIAPAAVSNPHRCEHLLERLGLGETTEADRREYVTTCHNR